MDKRSSDEAKAKRAATMMARHGVSSAMQSKEIVEKANATKRANFGTGKPPGSGRRKMTKDEFVERARAIHGDKYDYSLVVMAGNSVKVDIICPIHGVFSQTPAKHLQGRGCTHKDCIASKKIATSMARFGVSNAMKSDSIVKKLELSNLAKYGVSNAMKRPDVQAKAVSTNLAKYQVPYTCMAESVRKKRAVTMQARYGGNSPMCDATVREKQAATMCRKYQVAHALQARCFIDKLAATNLARYGVPNVMQSDEIKAVYESACMLKYGVASPFASREIRDKIQATCLLKYGSIGPMSSPDVQAKRLASWREKYGVDNPMQSQLVRDSFVASVLHRYGVENPMQVLSFQKRQRQGQAISFFENYGTDVALRVSSVRDKAVNTNLQKYGVANPMQCKQIADKMTATKLQNHTINTSVTEDILYDQLCDVFGKDDVIRQYKSCRYDWNCDFYVKSRDMFIELNASFFHNRHWFDDANSNDCAELSAFMSKALLDSNSSYVGVVKTWSVYDVRKRQDARDANLNYIVFWDNDLRDAAVWFAMGCPDGQDWLHEYSWLPERDIRGIDLNTLPVLSSNPANFSLIAKAYQFHVFYAREEQLWRDNRRVRKNLPVQLFLYYNRLRYKNFVPDRVSDLQLMRAFTVSGVFKGYTVFDSRLMDLAVSKYNIKSIYDPCAGWGERGLYCKSRDMKYLGVDINHALFAGYDKMRQEYNMQEQQFVESDSASVALFDNYDAVLTCPPYGSTEIYSPNGSENLDDFEFLNWWRDVVRNSLSVNPRYFCFQINQKWRDSMISVTQEFNLRLIDELFYNTSRVSHLNRKPGGVKLKREFESMLIFEIY